MPKKSLVVIGAGMVGHQFCEELVRRQAQHSFDVTLVGAEPVRMAYDRIRLHEILLGAPDEALRLRDTGWYAAQGVRYRAGRAVTGIDHASQKVYLEHGESLPYDGLVLATGSRARRPDLPGVDLPGVFAYRTLADLHALREAIAKPGDCCVLGGGVLGVEVALTARRAGCTVTVLERSDQLLRRQFDSASAAALAERVHAAGIDVRTKVQLDAISRQATGLSLHLAGGEKLPTGVLVLTMGVAPEDQLARDCGLAVDDAGGVVVDDALQTSDPAIFAIGECAAHAGNVPGLVAPGYAMAAVLADRLLGGATVFRPVPAPLLSRPDHADLGVIAYGLSGEAPPGCRTLVAHDRGSRRRLVLRGRVPVGLTAVGDWPELGLLREHIDAGKVLPAWRLWRFRMTGQVFPSLAEHASFLPDSGIVCHCMGVTREMLEDSYSTGQTSLTALCRDTGAGQVCGSCRPALQRFLGLPALDQIDTRTRKLFLAALAACLLILYIVFSEPPPVTAPFSGSPAGWLPSISAEASGYLALSLALVGLGVSLRKYWNRFRIGSLATWRILHATLGLSCLLVLVEHTGLRMGENLNFLLMADLLALTFIGTVLGMLMAAELRLARFLPRVQLQRFRQRLTRLHRFVYSLFPVLVVFHIIASYRY